MSLTSYDHPKAKELVEWVSNESKKELALGHGLMFFSETQEGYDLAVLTARAFILSDMTKLHCVSFFSALEYEAINMFWTEKPPLLITNFKPDHSVDPERYRRLENLLNYYLDNNIPFFLHMPVDVNVNPVEYGNQISPVFLDRLNKNNKKFIIT